MKVYLVGWLYYFKQKGMGYVGFVAYVGEYNLQHSK